MRLGSVGGFRSGGSCYAVSRCARIARPGRVSWSFGGAGALRRVGRYQWCPDRAPTRIGTPVKHSMAKTAGHQRIRRQIYLLVDTIFLLIQSSIGCRSQPEGAAMDSYPEPEYQGFRPQGSVPPPGVPEWPGLPPVGASVEPAGGGPDGRRSASRKGLGRAAFVGVAVLALVLFIVLLNRSTSATSGDAAQTHSASYESGYKYGQTTTDPRVGPDMAGWLIGDVCTGHWLALDTLARVPANDIDYDYINGCGDGIRNRVWSKK